MQLHIHLMSYLGMSAASYLSKPEFVFKIELCNYMLITKFSFHTIQMHSTFSKHVGNLSNHHTWAFYFMSRMGILFLCHARAFYFYVTHEHSILCHTWAFYFHVTHCFIISLR